MASSFGLPQFIIARLIVGFGNAGLLATVPVWQAEIAKAINRGSHVVTTGIFMGIGVCVGLWVDFGLYFVTDSSVSWRFPLAFQLLFLIPSTATVMFMPESPRWLVKTGKDKEAASILAVLHDEDIEAEVICNDVRDIQQSLSLSDNHSWTAMFTMGDQRFFHRTAIGFCAGMFQQLNGINVSSIYATTIFEQYLGLDATRSRILAACMCMMQILGGWLAYYTIDRLGRRRLMLSGSVGMAICMAILAGTTSVADNTGALVVAVIALYAFQFIFTVGWAGIAFLYATEVAPLQLRAAISALANTAIWTMAFLLAEITPIGFNTIANNYWIIFAVINAVIIFPVVYFFFPETSGRTLEEIDDIFLQSKSIWDPVRLSQVLPTMIATEGTSSPPTEEEEKHTSRV